MTSTLALLEDEDSTLIGRALAGHGECFTVLMDRYSAALESYRRARCRPLGRPLVDRARDGSMAAIERSGFSSGLLRVPASGGNEPSATPENRARKHSSYPALEPLPRRRSDAAPAECSCPLLAASAGPDSARKEFHNGRQFFSTVDVPVDDANAARRPEAPGRRRKTARHNLLHVRLRLAGRAASGRRARVRTGDRRGRRFPPMASPRSRTG